MPSLADLYLARGNQAADTVLRDAAIRSQQQQASGANWGRSLATIGQTVAAIPGQIEQAKDDAQARELTHLKLDATRADAARTQKLQQIQQQFGSDPDTLIGALRSNGFIEEADRAQDHVLKTTLTHLQTEGEKTQNWLSSTKLATQMLNGVSDDATLQKFRAAVPVLFPDKETQAFVLQQVDGPYDPAKIETAKTLGMAQSEIQSAQDAALRRTTQGLQNSKTVADMQQTLLQNAAELLASSSSPQAYAQHLAWIRSQSPQIADQFGQKGDAADIAGAKKIAIGPVKGEELSIQRQNANRLSAAAGGGATGDDAKTIAQAIIEGKQPPTLTGLYRFAAPVRAELARQGYDLTTATEDWNAVTKYLATLNGAQQTRLRQAVTFANDSLDIIEDLNGKWNGGRFPLLNKANLAAAKQGVYGQDVQSVATQLEAQINDLVSELGTVYKGGNASTDESLRLAASNLKADWSKKTLDDAIKLVRKNLTIRTNSIRNTEVAGGANNQYAPKTGGASNDPMGIR
jgi:hypothetical protein